MGAGHRDVIDRREGGAADEAGRGKARLRRGMDQSKGLQVIAGSRDSTVPWSAALCLLTL